MSRRRFFSLISDLFHVLPSRERPEWQEFTRISGDKPTVVLVSGFAATNRNLSVIRKRLIKDGFDVIILSLDWHALVDSVQGFYPMTRKLSATILELRKGPCRGEAKIFVVAHSAGGLVARYYVQLLGGFHYCDGLVTLGTPHQGTWLALLGLGCHLILKARCLLQMLPVSPFIQKINHSPIPTAFKMVSIFSKDDPLCNRKATQVPDSVGDQLKMESVELAGLSHGEFLVSKRCYQIMVRYLGKTIAEEALGSVS